MKPRPHHRRLFCMVAAMLLVTTLSARGGQDPVDQDPPPGAPQRVRPQRVTDQPARRPTDRAQPFERAVRVPDNVELVRDVVYATLFDESHQPLDLTMDVAFLKQSDGAPMPAVVYIHGGGYRGGSKEQGLPFGLALAQGGYLAVSINYRLSDQATYPAAVHDCKAAVRFLRANHEELGIDPNRIGVWGHSAGGHLAALLSVTGNTGDEELDGAVGVTEVSSAVTCAVDISGPSDLVSLTGNDRNGIIAQWMGGMPDERADAYRDVSPITHVDADDPPLLIVHGTNDRLVPIAQSEQLHEAMREAGASVELVRVEDAGHAVLNREVYRQIAVFFDAHLGGQYAEVAPDRPDRSPRRSDDGR